MIRIVIFLLMTIIIVACSTQSTITPDPTPNPVNTAQPTPVRILRIDSYHAEFAWSAEIRKGILAALSDNGYPLDETKMIFDERYLDTKRNTTEEYFAQIATETIAYIQQTQPDVVIVNDDNGARLIIQPMRDEGIPFVILGLNGTPEKYDFGDSKNVAGVLERPHATEMMIWIEKVFGENTRVAILAEESLTTEQMFGDGTVDAAINATSIKKADMKQTNNFAEWQAYVQNAATVSDVLFLGAYSTLRGENDSVIEPIEALQWTLENSKIPVMGFWEEAVHIGTLGGPIISGYNQGYEAALRAIKILAGISPQEIGFDIPPRGKLMVNRHAVEKWAVKIPLDLLEVSEIVES